MAGNDHPDFSKPVMVGCILGLADAENHLDSILGKLEPFCTAGTLGAGATNFRRFGSPWLQHSPHRVWARDEKRSPRLDFGR